MDIKIREFSFPKNQSFSPRWMTAGPDGALWFTEDGGWIGRIDVHGKITEYELPAPKGRPWGIEHGPDGALWFTLVGANKIGRITAAGKVTEYDVPTQNSDPTKIVTGPDGALWFTEARGNKIGRITTSGEIREYVIPTPKCSPNSIAVGSDGALWFTETTGNKIGRITTAGTVTEYALPKSKSFPLAIAAGSDGALWFTELQGNKIGRITVGGAISEHEIPTPDSEPMAITSGPDGALWFTEGQGNKLGRIETNGKITEYEVPSKQCSPSGIAVGPDGALWFTEYDAARIGATNPVVKLRRLGPDGADGIPFDDSHLALTFASPMTAIHMRHGCAIDQLRAVYASHRMPGHGGDGGGPSEYVFDPGDVLVKVVGSYGMLGSEMLLLSLEFQTRRGRTYGYRANNVPWYGDETSMVRGNFTYEGNPGERIAGFFGSVKNDPLTCMSSLGVIMIAE